MQGASKNAPHVYPSYNVQLWPVLAMKTLW